MRTQWRWRDTRGNGGDRGKWRNHQLGLHKGKVGGVMAGKKEVKKARKKKDEGKEGWGERRSNK